MDLKDLYRDVILDHNKQPRNFGRLDPCDTSADGNNPLCGDRLTVTLRIAGGRVSDIRFEGKGCAISTASASLMTEAVKGLDAAQIHALHARVHGMLTEHGDALPPTDLGKLAALAGVREEAKVGQRTTLDVLNAQQLLLNARVNLITAQRDRVVGSYALVSATGRLSSATLGLKVDRYDPTIHYDQVKDKWWGVGTPDGR